MFTKCIILQWCSTIELSNLADKYFAAYFTLCAILDI